MFAEYWQIVILCLILLFLKSFAYGNFIQLEIAEIHNNKYFKKHKSKNFFVNYFYLDYFKEVNKALFILNILLPVISFFLFFIESIVFIVNSDILFAFGDVCFALAVLIAVFSFVFAMIYSWWDSASSIGLILLAIIVILMPIIYLLFKW